MTKLSAVLEAVHDIPIAELDSSLSTCNTRPSLEDRLYSLSPELAHQLDSFRLALVPFQTDGGSAVANASRNDNGRQIRVAHEDSLPRDASQVEPEIFFLAR